jgi:hypothetical protein
MTRVGGLSFELNSISLIQLSEPEKEGGTEGGVAMTGNDRSAMIGLTREDSVGVIRGVMSPSDNRLASFIHTYA